MHELLRRLKCNGIFNYLYLANLLLAFHYFFVVYINSSYLNTVISENVVGLLYTAGAAVTIILLFLSTKLLRQLGNFRLTIAFIVIEMVALFGLAMAEDPLWLMLYFVIHWAVTPFMLFNLDVFLESYSADENTTGRIRGIFLSVMNVAVVLSPFLVGLILVNEEYYKVYLSAILFLILLLWVINGVFRPFKDPPYLETRVVETIHSLWRDANRRDVFIANFLLQLFYIWMVVYLPLYLNVHIGFSWEVIGPMLTAMLLPFLLFQYPVGRIADKWLGEKELMAIGFALMAIATASLSFITTLNPFIWILALFLTRTGASMVEITTESYFFKKVDGDDAQLISMFRITRPLASIIGPAAATAALFFLPFHMLFFLLGAILLIGIYYSLVIVDTK